MRNLFSQKDNATFKIDFFWKVGIGGDNFKLYDILVGKPEKRAGTRQKKHFKTLHYMSNKISQNF